jgi:D-amino-acid dehydrogenase
VLTKDPDVLVIGGGIIGVCSLYYAAKAGSSVALVERGEICSGCSWGNAGWLVPSHCIPLAAPGVLSKALKWMWSSRSPFSIKPRFDWGLMRWLVAFAAACNEQKVRASIPLLRDLTFASLKLYQELIASEAMSCGYRGDGTLMLFATAKGLADGRRDAEMLEESGIASQQWQPNEVLHREPSIVPGIAGGIFYPDDAQISPAVFVESLAKISQRLGATVVTSTQVTGFSVANGTIQAVKTSQGDFRPRSVILAAGVESSTLAHKLGIRLPIQAGKGYSFSIPSSTFSPSRPLLLSEAKVAITPLGDKIRFGGTLELSGIDHTINAARLRAIRESSSRYLTPKLPLVLDEQWSGLRPCTPDGLPVISVVPALRNLIVASGHAMLGVSLGPVTGKLAAQLARGEPADLDVSSLRISRFG